MRNKILTKFGFKRIWIEKHGKFIELWGEFNPKILFLREDGKKDSRDLLPEEIDEIKLRRGDTRIVGEKLDNSNVVVSDNYAKDFVDVKTKHTLDDLENMDAETIRKLSGNLEGTRELRGKIEGPQPKNFQAHHIIPRELEKTFGKFFEDIDFIIENGAINGIMVPPSDDILKVAKLDIKIPITNQFDDYATHLGSHPDYTELIENKIIRIRSNYNSCVLTKADALNEIKTLTDNARTAISSGKGLTINQIKF